MKYKFSLLTLLPLVIITLGFYESPAQRKLISLSEYSAKTIQPMASAQEMTRRVTNINETFVDGLVTKTVETMSEEVISGGSRIYIKTNEGNKVTETERVIINDIRYIRDNGGSWKIESDNPFARLVIGGGLQSPPAGKQYSVESVFLNGLPMQMFDAFFVFDKDEGLTFQNVRKWLGQDGLVYRDELILGKLSPRTETYRSVTTYEYDPKDLKIEAPIK